MYFSDQKYEDVDVTTENFIENNFLFDITTVPGSSEDVALLAIQHYHWLANNPNINSDFREIATALEGNLQEYYNLSKLYDNPTLRLALEHLSASTKIMSSKSPDEAYIDSSGRIKSFYSAYQKIIEKVTSDYEKKKPLASSGILKDVYATRDVFTPKFDLKFHPERFYQVMYEDIYEYMQYIESLGPGYEIVEYSENDLRKIYANKINTFDPNVIIIPKKDFFDYCIEIENDKKDSPPIEHGYRYIAELSQKLTPEELKEQISTLKKVYEQTALTSNTSNNQANNASVATTTNNNNNNKANIDLSNFSGIEMVNMLSNNIQKENLFDLKLLYEQEFLRNVNDKKMAKDYAQMLPDEFLEKYKLSQYNCDLYNLLVYLNNCIESSEVNSKENSLPKFSSKELMLDFNKNLKFIENKHNDILKKQIEEINEIDLTNFDQNYAKALKIRHFSRSAKDYMKYPKDNGYQSFHMIVKTPRFVYEKQIRNDAQHNFSEKGPASHDTVYKPAAIKSNFHRLKVPYPFSPKRDKNGELVTPYELGVLPFEEAVRDFYKTPFSHFAGMSFAEFEKQFTTKEEFDQALLDLTINQNDEVMKGKITTCIKRFFASFLPKPSPKKKTPEATVSTLAVKPKPGAPIMEEIPKDIATYSSFSSDDTDPHDDR